MRALAKQSIVILRPLPQAQRLADRVKAMGATPIILPMIDIIPLPHTLTLTRPQIVFVITANAIHCASEALLRQLKDVQIISMGKGTTQAIEAKGLNVYFTPPSGTTSESLLEEAFLQSPQVTGKKILMLCGETGRALLQETLKARGAEIEIIRTYRQQRPNLDLVDFYQNTNKLPYVFIATSLAILENLLFLTPPEHHAWLKKQPLVVVSERIDVAAKKMGFQQVYNSIGADEDAVMAAIKFGSKQ